MRYINKYRTFESDDSPRRDFSEFFPIKDDEILDLCAEMEDLGFIINIGKRFSSGRRGLSDQPLAKNSYPIYDIDFSLSQYEEKNDPDYLYDGGYRFQSIDMIRTFTSVLNKMKMLPIKGYYYVIKSDVRYTIRLVLEQINIDDRSVGFDFYKFVTELHDYIDSLEDVYGFKITESFGSGSDKLIQIFTNGIYSISDGNKNEDKIKLNKKWETCDRFDNKDQYSEISEVIEDYLDNHIKFIKYTKEFEERGPIRKTIKKIFGKSVDKVYNRYYLSYRIKLKD